MKIPTVLLAQAATIVVLMAIALFSACAQKPTRTICSHPGIAGGMAFTLPPGGFVSHNGQVYLSVKGDDLALLGAVCITMPDRQN